MLPDRSILIGLKLMKNANWNETLLVIFKHCEFVLKEKCKCTTSSCIHQPWKSPFKYLSKVLLSSIKNYRSTLLKYCSRTFLSKQFILLFLVVEPSAHLVAQMCPPPLGHFFTFCTSLRFFCCCFRHYCCSLSSGSIMEASSSAAIEKRNEAEIPTNA